MPLLWTRTRPRFGSGVSVFQVTSQCQQHTLSLRRGVPAPPKRHLSLRDRGFFLIYTLWNISRAFKCSQWQAAASAAATQNLLCSFRSVYLLYGAATLIRKLLSSPHCFPQEYSVLSDLQIYRAVALGLSPHRGKRACWLRNINLPNDL